MLCNTDRRLTLKVWRIFLSKRVIAATLLIGTLVLLSSCTPLTKHLDRRMGFSDHLAQTKDSIREEEWPQAASALKDAKTDWEKIKPIMQVDIDHDYIKEIEDDFTLLGGYLETRDKSNALSTILLIEDTWENIDSL